MRLDSLEVELTHCKHKHVLRAKPARDWTPQKWAGEGQVTDGGPGVSVNLILKAISFCESICAANDKKVPIKQHTSKKCVIQRLGTDD